MRVKYVFSCRWSGDLCPAAYSTKSKAEFEKELIAGGWEKLPEDDGSYRWYFGGTEVAMKQKGFGAHGVILEGELKDGILNERD